MKTTLKMVNFDMQTQRKKRKKENDNLKKFQEYDIGLICLSHYKQDTIKFSHVSNIS